MRIVSLAASVLMWPIAAYAQAPTIFEWPADKQATVSLTSDDGWHSQLEQASLLNKYNVKGTFYLTNPERLFSDQDGWRRVYMQGHEVANHTASHFCRGSAGSQDLSTKSEQDVANDVDRMEGWLNSHIYGGNPVEHTFAYPCGDEVIGPGVTQQEIEAGRCSYMAVLSRVVNAGRNVDGGENIPTEFYKNRFNLNGTAVGTKQEAFSAIKNALDKHAWLILVFHSLGEPGDGNSISREDYEAIVERVSNSHSKLWVASVIDVEKYLRAQVTGRQDWSCNP